MALAGIMGGLHSEIRPNTTRVLLESANFKASRIRRTSVRLDLRTDAAQRFEKSQPPANVKVGRGAASSGWSRMPGPSPRSPRASPWPAI